MKITLRRPGDEDLRWPSYMFWGRVRTSTVALLVAFGLCWYVYDNYTPGPAAPPVQEAPPGMVPVWVPQTQVYNPPEETYTEEPTPTAEPTLTEEPTPTDTATPDPNATTTTTTTTVDPESLLPPWMRPLETTTTAPSPEPGAPPGAPQPSGQNGPGASPSPAP
ncbi:hypothetical protein [Mycolicibacterium brumae]|uniref:Uncharacterized protein n=1 Tax=Mycolicibacterium brumae TaxID=85968 RepID=A0A2G5P6B0_9MYCO|nr:hypothetical protein [Mycolicibacterium brumae]MCV7194273.1 hypothetical protein [Mycolicibacterium brumae]PIB73899.1 hypothetical protein CQY22_014835 [Mycolicibacterium brumae]RWA20295.1 hypothetical protein MBRU_15615 [Mycolicibacterium brumae DSM 44177]UWW09627.1 hypothetical protein L2Z93_002736 [Mycolicibacterium brumae]